MASVEFKIYRRVSEITWRISNVENHASKKCFFSITGGVSDDYGKFHKKNVFFIETFPYKFKIIFLYDLIRVNSFVLTLTWIPALSPPPLPFPHWWANLTMWFISMVKDLLKSFLTHCHSCIHIINWLKFEVWI